MTCARLALLVLAMWWRVYPFDACDLVGTPHFHCIANHWVLLCCFKNDDQGDSSFLGCVVVIDPSFVSFEFDITLQHSNDKYSIFIVPLGDKLSTYFVKAEDVSYTAPD